MKLLLVAAAASVFVVAGCGDDDDDDPAGEDAIETTQPSGDFETSTPESETTSGGELTAVLGDDGRGLYVYSPDGSGERLAGGDDLGQRGVGLDWFPDGESIAAFGANLLRVGLDGEAQTIYQPEDLVFGTQVSPDGSRIAFSCSGPTSSDVCIVPAEPGGQLTRASEDEYFDYLIDWLDNERILILSDGRPGAPDIPVYEEHFPDFAGYFVLNTLDGNIVPATEADVGDPWLSPEGEWTFEIGAAPTYAFFSRTTGANIDVPVDPADIEAVDPTALPDQFDVAWSNGDIYAALVQRVAVEEAGLIRSAYNVWLVDLNAGSVELLVRTDPCETNLDCLVTVDWSPDASALAILFGVAGD